MSLKKSKKRVICFVFYEKVDRWTYGYLQKRLKKINSIKTKIITGFSYDTYINNHKVNKNIFPDSLAKNKLSFLNPAGPEDEIFLHLIKNKFHSLETKVLLKQIGIALDALNKTIDKHKPELFIIPEDTDCVRGRLAAAIARKNKIKTMVLLPLYYEWISTYPLLGKRLADFWLAPGINYKKRLLKLGIKAKKITPLKLYLKNRKGFKTSKSEDNFFEKHLKEESYYLVTLQNDDFQELTVQMVSEAFKLLPAKSVLFKFHPATPKEEKTRLKQKFASKNIYFSDKLELAKLIRFSQGLITISSTSILSALNLNKPVILLKLSPFFSPTSQFKTLKTVKTPKELIKIISKLGGNSYRKKYTAIGKELKNDYLANQGSFAKNYYFNKIIKG